MGLSLPEHSRSLPRASPAGPSASWLQGLVPFPKVEEKPSVLRSEDLSWGQPSLSFQGKIAQPLFLCPQALSLASTRILFLQGTDSTLPT